MNGARSVHVAGASTGIAIDLRLIAGRGGEGTVSENGLSFNMVRIGTKAYFEGSAGFWQHVAGKAAAQLFKGRWIEASATSGELASFTPLTSIAKLFNQILSSHGTLAKGGETTIDGRPAFALIDTTEGGTLYVAASGAPVPLRLTPKGGKGAINFTAWNQPVSLVAPKNAIDFASLRG